MLYCNGGRYEIDFRCNPWHHFYILTCKCMDGAAHSGLYRPKAGQNRIKYLENNLDYLVRK